MGRARSWEVRAGTSSLGKREEKIVGGAKNVDFCLIGKATKTLPAYSRNY